MRNGMLKFYKKGQGAAQLRLIPPRLTEKGFLDKEGAVLIETAPGVGKGNSASWDWSQKVTFAISISDIMQIFDTDEVDIFHKNKGTNKKLNVKKGQNSGWFLTLSEQRDGGWQRNNVPLTDGEWRVVKHALLSIVPYLAGWEDTSASDVTAQLQHLEAGIRKVLSEVRSNETLPF